MIYAGRTPVLVGIGTATRREEDFERALEPLDLMLEAVAAAGNDCGVPAAFHGLEWHRSGRRASGSGGAYPYMILPCKDGEVCICGRTRDEWNRFVQAMGNPE